MTAVPSYRLMSLVSLALLVACGTESDPISVALRADRFQNAEWSTPEHLGAPVNSSATEQAPALSPNGLSLYFSSDRPGSLGATDLWVSQRDCDGCPWSAPANLGSVVNSTAGDAGPSLSIDGHLLFFTSSRSGGQGLNDIYVSRRTDPKDDFGWGPPVPLGGEVNTPAFEAGPEYLQSAEDGVANFYFNRGPTSTSQDSYYAAVARDGETRGPAVLVSELSDPDSNDAASTLRTDGHEVLFYSNRAGGLGRNDLWVSTRQTVHDPWSPPLNPGPPLNTTAVDQQPGLSVDGRTLVFVSNRSGSIDGSLDIWISTRSPGGH